MGAFDGLSTEEKLLACRNRAVEWLAFPMLLGQTLLPILYAIFPWQWMLLCFVASLVVWPFVRLRLANFKIATVGALIGKPKWFVAVGMAIYFYTQNEIFLAILSICTPLVMGALLMPYAAGQAILVIELQGIFMEQMGYTNEQV